MVVEQGGDAGVGGGRVSGPDDDDDTVARTLVDAAGGTFSLSGIHNFRDVAGHGYPVAPSTRAGSGASAGAGASARAGAGAPGSMARGVVYRSAALSATGGDLDALARLGIDTIVDLRTTTEVEMRPSMPVPGTRTVAVDILQDRSTAATLMNSGIVSVARAREEMGRTYERFVVGDGERAAFGRAVAAVAGSSGAALVHCTAGKDRTGWVSAVLQLLAGVSREDVLADYMLTRENSRELSAAIRQQVRDTMPEQAEAIEVLLDVDEAFLGRSLDSLEAEFGDVRRYLVEGAGLEGDLVDDLTVRLRT